MCVFLDWDSGRNIVDDTILKYLIPKSAALAYIHADIKRSSRWQSIDNTNVFTGPVCECCHNKCSLDEMVQYCKDPAKAMAQIYYNKK